MKLAIMFCNTPEIEIYDIPDDTEDVEEYIERGLGYNLDELTWQCYNSIENEIKISIL